MLSEPPSLLLLVSVCAVVLFVAVVTGRVWSARRIRRWCERQGYELLDWRGAWFYEGPGRWLRSENQDAYHIEVRDRQGLTRSGYLVFGSRWFPFPLSRKVNVRWD